MVHRSSRRGFTLIELLVVIAIIGILIGLLLPAVQKVREAANRMKCANNMKQLGIALHNFHGTHGAFPKAGKISNELSWHVFILPFIEQDALYKQFSFVSGSYCGSSGTGPNKNIHAVQNEIKMFMCPASTAEKMLLTAPNNVNAPEEVNGVAPYTTHYYGVMGPKGNNPSGKAYPWSNVGSQGGYALDGIFMADTNTASTAPGPDIGYAFSDILDGTSNTFLLGEMSWVNNITGTRYRSWVRGCDAANLVCAGCRNVAAGINTPSIALFNDIAFGSQHTGGCNFCFGDGSVRFMSENINMSTYLSLASRDGGETLGDY
jgi:prepilin-type N-terminal cleavage/methylation domain-containing protein/prepilin-type processing-associated H-X9-DG protein